MIEFCLALSFYHGEDCLSIVGFALIYLLLREKGDRIPGFPNANEMSFWGSWVAVDEE